MSTLKNRQLIIEGQVFILGDNIDTDQIIPAACLTLLPTIPEEYRKLGSYALSGLPDHCGKFIIDGQDQTAYPIIVAGKNFGCGSSREHAPIALGASGCQAVVAQSYARIYFRNCIATGEVFPVETEFDLTCELQTGEVVRLNLEENTLTRMSDGKTWALKDLGDARHVIMQGGIFNYARQTGMI